MLLLILSVNIIYENHADVAIDPKYSNILTCIKGISVKLMKILHDLFLIATLCATVHILSSVVIEILELIIISDDHVLCLFSVS